MSGRPRLVGLFVLGALALLVAVVVAISSGRFLSEWRTWVVFLPGAANGLKEGAPVTMRGVQIGEVRDVELFFTGKGHEVGIMVVIQVKRGSIRTLGGEARVAALSDAEVVRQQVAEGLRAELKSTSPVGGQKTIDLDFHPDRAPRFANIKTPWPEVPTAPTGMERLSEKVDEMVKKITDLPLDEVVTQLRDTLKSAQGLLDSGDLRGAIANLRTALGTANRTLESVHGTMGNVDALLGDARTTMTSAGKTVDSLRETTEALNRTLATVDRNVERTADTQLEAARTLDELHEVLTSMRFLIDTLQRHPESLLQGKPAPEGKK